MSLLGSQMVQDLTEWPTLVAGSRLHIHRSNISNMFKELVKIMNSSSLASDVIAYATIENDTLIPPQNNLTFNKCMNITELQPSMSARVPIIPVEHIVV